MGVSRRICTIVASSRAGLSSCAAMGRIPSWGTMLVWERWPRGAKRQARAMSRASSTVSMRGAMIPWAPPSSIRPIIPYSRSGTRTSAVSPRLSAAAHSWAATSVDMVECSRSTRMLWWPVERAMWTTSVVRLVRTVSMRVGSCGVQTLQEPAGEGVLGHGGVAFGSGRGGDGAVGGVGLVVEAGDGHGEWVVAVLDELLGRVVGDGAGQQLAGVLHDQAQPGDEREPVLG